MGKSSTGHRFADYTALSGRSTLIGLLGLIVGFAAGAITALLYAPKSGKKTRRELTKNLESSWNSGQDAIENSLDPVMRQLEKDVNEFRDTLEERIAKLR